MARRRVTALAVAVSIAGCGGATGTAPGQESGAAAPIVASAPTAPAAPSPDASAEPGLAPLEGWEVDGRFPLPGEPHDVLVAHGSVWVTVHEPPSVVRVDPVTGEVLATIEVRDQPWQLAADDRWVWVAHERPTGGLTRVDPTTDSVSTQAYKGTPFNEVVATGDTLWVSTVTNGWIASIDPETLELREKHDVGKGPAGLAVDDRGRVWVGVHRGVRLAVLEPATGEVQDLGRLDPGRLAFADGVTWVVDGGGRLTLDVAEADYWPQRVVGYGSDGEVVGEVAFPDPPRGKPGIGFLAVDGDHVWVPRKPGVALIRASDATLLGVLDLDGHREARGSSVFLSSVDAADGTVWVADADGDALWRIVPSA